MDLQNLPTQNQRRRERAVQDAVAAAERVILDASNGTEEETDWLTGAVALAYVNKVQLANSSHLLRLDFERVD